jgi:hypothetical protein
MAGYDGYSKSNNALAAEAEGKYPASVLARKLGVTVAAVREHLSPCETHHTSKNYNMTDYYDGAALIAALEGRPDAPLYGGLATVSSDGESTMCAVHHVWETPYESAKELLAAMKSKPGHGPEKAAQ